MAVSGDVYFARATGTYLGEQWINTYWYRLDGDEPTEPVPEVLTTLLRFHINALAQTLSDEWTMDHIEAMLWRDPATEYHINVNDVTGVHVGDPAPSFLTVSFESPSGPPSTRKGRKRISGLVETFISGNVISNVNEFNNFGVALGLQFGTGVALLTPCLVKSKNRPKLGAGVNPVVVRSLQGTWAYRLGTQNTRKAGVGS